MDSKRLALAFGWGVVATIVMSIIMILGRVMGMAPMPKPIPMAIVSNIFGEGIPRPLLMFLAVASHLGYGGFWSAVLAASTRPVTVWKGIALGIALWFIMQLVVLPLLGWGFFGMDITPRIAIATLILHLVYGVTLGWLVDRSSDKSTLNL